MGGMSLGFIPRLALIKNPAITAPILWKPTYNTVRGKIESLAVKVAIVIVGLK